MEAAAFMDDKQIALFQENFRPILDSISDPILVLAPDLRIIFANRAVGETFGPHFQDVRGMTCGIVFGKGHYQGEWPSCKVFADGQPHQAELTYFREHETAPPIYPRIYMNAASPVRDAEGNVVASVEVMRDITEMKALQDAIRRAKDRYQDLFENTTVTIYSTDVHGKIISLNRKGEELLGYSSKELIGRHVSVIFPEKEVVESLRRAQALLRGETITPYETEFIARNGERKEVEVYLSPIREDGHVVGFQGIASDITLRKQLEEEYKQFAQELEFHVAELSTLNQLGDMLMDTRNLDEILSTLLVAVTARQGLGFNRAFLLLLNPEKARLEGKFAIGPSDPHEAGIIWTMLDRKQQTLREILESIRHAGFQEDVHVNRIVRSLIVPMSHKDHVLVRALTEQRTLRVTDGHNGLGGLSGLDAVLGTRSFAIAPLVTPSGPVGMLLADNAITGRPIRDEDMGRLRVVAYYAAAAIENSLLHQSLQKKVKTLNKVTEDLRKHRDRLVRAEKLSAVGEMSATIAHEIRNPLVAIGGFSRYILKRMPQDDLNRNHLETIVKEVDRLENILRGVLDFVRTIEVHPVPTSLNEIIQQIFEMLETELMEASVEPRLELGADIPELLIDPDRILQVLINIYRNAIQAMPEGGTLTVRSFRKDDRVVVEIEDTGVGLPNPEDSKIFEPFYTTKQTGLGLGLTISSQILKIHGGTISARAAKERGTIFTIELPLKHA